MNVNKDKTWINGDWFYSKQYCVFGDGAKATKSSPPESHATWIITNSKGFKMKCIKKRSISVRACVNLFLASQFQAI